METNLLRIEKGDTETEGLATTVFFFHIHKTAGLTMRSILKNQYRNKPYIIFNADNKNSFTMNDYLALSEAERSKLKLVMGHMPLGLHRYHRNPCAYFAFLRNPLDRLASLYYYSLQKQGPIHDEIEKYKMTLADFLASDFAHTLDNFQIRMIMNEKLLDNTIVYELDPYESWMLESAKKRIENHFLIVGITELFDESIMLLHHTFGWSTPFYSKVNVSSSKPEVLPVTMSDIQAFTDRNEADYKLYEFALVRLKLQLLMMGEDFAQAVRAFKIFKDSNLIASLSAKT